MTKADKMFDELGFNKYELDIYIDYLSRTTRKGITFRKDMQMIDSYRLSKKYIQKVKNIIKINYPIK